MAKGRSVSLNSLNEKVWFLPGGAIFGILEKTLEDRVLMEDAKHWVDSCGHLVLNPFLSL